MCCVAATFVPQILMSDQKQWHLDVRLELPDMADDHPTFISRIIMGDDIWVYGYDPETKQQSSQLKESTLTKTKQTGQVQNATTKNAHGFFFQ